MQCFHLCEGLYPRHLIAAASSSHLTQVTRIASVMEWLFGRKQTPEELLRQNQRVLNKAIRELERERTKMEGQVSGKRSGQGDSCLTAR